jgi:hypothetical protein
MYGEHTQHHGRTWRRRRAWSGWIKSVDDRLMPTPVPCPNGQPATPLYTVYFYLERALSASANCLLVRDSEIAHGHGDPAGRPPVPADETNGCVWARRSAEAEPCGAGLPGRRVAGAQDHDREEHEGDTMSGSCRRWGQGATLLSWKARGRSEPLRPQGCSRVTLSLTERPRCSCRA